MLTWISVEGISVFLRYLKPWVRDLHKVQISDFSDFRGCVWRGYGRHRGSCVMPLAWVGHEIWYTNKNRKLFRKQFFFDENFIFEKIWKSKIINKKSHFSKKKYHFFSLIFHWKKWLFWRNFSDFFSSRKIFFVQLFVSKKSSNFFLESNFWSRFFLTYALCDFLSIEHVFEWIPAFKKCVNRYFALWGA